MRAHAIVKLAFLGLVLVLWFGPAVSVHAAPASPPPAAGWVEWLADAWSRWLFGVEAASVSDSHTDPDDDDELVTVVSGDGPALTETTDGGDGEQFPGLDPDG